LVDVDEPKVGVLDGDAGINGVEDLRKAIGQRTRSLSIGYALDH
jgi:hypothetical protein